GRKPGVEDVFVAAQCNVRAQIVFFARSLFVASDINLPGVVVPGRNAVPPPQLARNAPILDVAHPFVIGLGPVFRHEADASGFDGLDRRLGQRFRAYEPLLGQHGLDDDVGAVAVGLHHGLVFDRNHQPFGVDVGDDPVARLVAIQAAVGVRHQVDQVDIAGVRRDAGAGDFVGLGGGVRVGCAIAAQIGLVVHQPVHGDGVTFSDFVVVEVVGAGDLDRAGAEFRIRVFVGNDRNQASVLFRPDRNFAAFADNRRIAFIIGVYGNGAVAEHGFRTRRGDGDVVAGFAQRDVTVGVLFDVFVGFAIGQ